MHIHRIGVLYNVLDRPWKMLSVKMTVDMIGVGWHEVSQYVGARRAICYSTDHLSWLGCRLGDLGNNNSNDDNDDDDEQDNEQAPPLLAVTAAGLVNGTSNLGIGLYNIFVDLLAFLLDVGNKRFLLLNNLVKVLEELGKLHHLALNVLNGFVALLDVTEGRRGLATAV